MQQSRIDRFQAFVWAVALHIAALVLLMISLHFNKPQIIAPPASQIMNAVAVDQDKVEAEIKKLREQDKKKEEQQNQDASNAVGAAQRARDEDARRQRERQARNGKSDPVEKDW